MTMSENRSLYSSLKFIFGFLSKSDLRYAFFIPILGILEALSIYSIVPFISLISGSNSSNLELVLVFLKIDSVSDFYTQVSILGFITALCVFIFSALKTLLYFKINLYIELFRSKISQRQLRKYFSLYDQVFTKYNAPEITKKLTSDVDLIIRQLVRPLFQCLSGLAIAVFVLLLLFTTDWVITLFLIGSMVFIYVFIFFFINAHAYSAGRIATLQDKKRFGSLDTLIKMYKIIKISGSDKAFLSKFDRSVDTYAHAIAKYNFLSVVSAQALEFFMILLIILGPLVLWGTGGDDIIEKLSIFGLSALRLRPALQQVYTAAIGLKYGSEAIKNLELPISKISNTSQLEKESQSYLSNHRTLEIRINNLKYPPEFDRANIFDGFSTQFKGGTWNALIGPSGAGKTTLLELLSKFSTPGSGSIEINGVSITDVPDTEWWRNLAYVPQHTELFDGTLFENIAMTDNLNEVDQDLLREVLEVAQLSDLVATWASGICTILGSEGAVLSGGQLQRIGIARALYRKAKLYLFDECTSALDVETELKLLNKVKTFTEGSTVIFVSHRPAPIMFCEETVELKGN